MPPVKNNTPQSKRARIAASASSRFVASAIHEKLSLPVARVDKVLGGKRFHLSFFDGEKLHTEVLATPRGLFSAGGRVRVRIGTGDFVVLDGAEMIKESREKGKDVTMEIYGILDKPEAERLYKAGRIHESLYKSEDALDDLFDRSGSAEANAETEAELAEQELDLNDL
jgi:hypothetical protein